MPGFGNDHFRIGIPDLKQRGTFFLKCFLPGNVITYLNINFFAAPLSNKVNFLFIELADIDIVSTAKKFDANDILINSAIVHISASQNCVSNTAVTQIKFLRAFEIFCSRDCFHIVTHFQKLKKIYFSKVGVMYVKAILPK